MAIGPPIALMIDPEKNFFGIMLGLAPAWQQAVKEDLRAGNRRGRHLMVAPTAIQTVAKTWGHEKLGVFYH